MLHPRAAALLRLMVEKGVPPTHTLPPAAARAFYLERRGITQPEPPPVGEVRDLQAAGPNGVLPIRSYRPLDAPAGRALPALVYYHGGGWVMGDLDTHDTLCRQLCEDSGCAVLAVDYRLAPEHPFPAAVDDAVAALRWVRANAASLGISAARLGVAGDSAGGNLAAVAAIATRDDEGAAPLRLQLLIYPATDARCGATSHTSNGEGYLLTRETIAYFLGHYLGDARGASSDAAHLSVRSDWRASPLLAEDLARLPPAFVLTAGYDPLRDEGLQYAQRLSEAGVPTSLVCFERQIHGFITMGRVIDEANTAVQLCAAQMRVRL